MARGRKASAELVANNGDGGAADAGGGGRKRKNEEPPNTPKRSKSGSRKKEDGKENKSSSSSVSSSGAASPNVSIIVNYHSTSRRKTTKPVKLENIDKKFDTASTPQEITNHYTTHKETEARRFLLRNVVKGKLVIDKKAKCKERKMPKLESTLDDLELDEELMKEKDLHRLCTVNIQQVRCWNTLSDLENWATDHSTIQGYVIIVFDDNTIKVIDNGLSFVDLKEKSLREDDLRNVKDVMATSGEMNNAKYVYYAAIVRRMTSNQVAKRGATRKSIATDNTHIADPSTLKQMLSFGCIRMYEKGRPNRMNHGYGRIILVEKEDSPVFEVMWNTDWMRNQHHLDRLHEENVTKQFQDSLLPRVVFYSSSPKTNDAIISTTPSTPVKAPQQSKNEPWKNGNGLTPIEEINQLIDNGAFQTRCALRTHLRFPCYILYETKNLVADPAYFADTTTKYYDDFTFFRRSRDRGVAMSKRRRADELKAKVAARNVGVKQRKIYGLDFVMAGNGNYFESVVYKNRRNLDYIPALRQARPITDETIPNKESYPCNNSKLFNELHFQSELKIDLPEEYRVGTSDMSIIRIKPTEEYKKVFHAKLINPIYMDKKSITKRKRKPIVKAPPRQRNPEHRIGAPDTDADGRPLPTFAELFFPSGKTEIYDILQRYYLSRAGARPGAFSADFKSRILHGFIVKNSDHVFQYNLGDIFEKQIQLVGLSTRKWTKDHFNFPRDKYNELKADWERRHPKK